MLNNKEKEILKDLREIVKKEIIKQNIKAPIFSIQCDYKTKKLKLNYSFSKYKGLNKFKNKVYSKKQKDFYLKNITLKNKEKLVENLSHFIQLLNKKINDDFKKSLDYEKKSMIYWYKIYTTSLNRFNNRSIKESSLKGDKESIGALILYCKRFDKKMLDIWKWPKKGEDLIKNYMNFKQSENSENKKIWSNSTVNSHYQRIRAFFNWLSFKNELFPSNIIGRMDFKKEKKGIKVFKNSEILNIKSFIDKNNSKKEWKWFIEILVLMLETGLKIEKVCRLELNNINVKEKSINIKLNTKADSKIVFFPLTDYCWRIISNLILNKNKSLRSDKNLIFHSRFYRKPKNNLSNKGKLLIENLNKGFSENGFRKKFKEMISVLGLSSDLTPQACRHYYIIEMLKNTNGDISLVSDKTGLSSRIIVEKYIEMVDIKRKEKQINLFSKEIVDSKTKTKRLKGGGVSVPFMITREMFRELISIGYSKTEINEMKSEEAHKILTTT